MYKGGWIALIGRTYKQCQLITNRASLLLCFIGAHVCISSYC